MKIQFSSLIITPLLSLSASGAVAQGVTGTVYELADASAKKSPLPGANVYWSGTMLGAVTDPNGRFSISRSAQSNQLVVSFVGYQNDTLKVTAVSEVEFVLRSAQSLDEVVIQGSSTTIDCLSPTQTEIITSRALAKAACCNLSESLIIGANDPFESRFDAGVVWAPAVGRTIYAGVRYKIKR